MTTNAKWPSSSLEGEPDGLDEIALVVPLDQVGDRLGVGLRRERVALRASDALVSSR